MYAVLRFSLVALVVWGAAMPDPSAAAASAADSSQLVAAQLPHDPPLEAGAIETAGQNLPVSVAYDATIASKYLFQGVDYSDGRTVVQPNLNFGFKQFSAGAWFNYQPDIEQLNEVDLTLKVGRDIALLSVAAGYLHLDYPNRPTWDPSQEVFLELGLSAPFNPTLSVHYDFDAGLGSYSTLGLSRKVAPLVTVGTNLFYQDHYYKTTGIPSAEFNVKTEIPFGAMTLTPSLSYFATWHNRDFRGDTAIPSTWFFSVNASR